MPGVLYETGPDLSHYQGSAVDFGAIRRAGHAFVVLKATEGDYSTDPLFAANRAKARAAGLYVGLYHFARAGDPVSEANHFADVVGAVSPMEWTVTDEEVYSADPPAWVGVFADRVHARLASMPVSYLNQAGRDRWNWAPVVACGSKLWLAKYDGVYTDKPGGPGAWPAVAMEQYTDNGICPGVLGAVDMNVFYGAAADLPALSRPTAPIPTPAPVLEDIDMALLIRNKSGAVHLVLGDRNIPVKDPKDYASLQAAGVQSANLSDALISSIIAATGAPQAPAPVPPPAA